MYSSGEPQRLTVASDHNIHPRLRKGYALVSQPLDSRGGAHIISTNTLDTCILASGCTKRAMREHNGVIGYRDYVALTSRRLKALGGCEKHDRVLYGNRTRPLSGPAASVPTRSRRNLAYSRSLTYKDVDNKDMVCNSILWSPSSIKRYGRRDNNQIFRVVNGGGSVSFPSQITLKITLRRKRYDLSSHDG
jgi:hypothetical protein